MAKAAKKQEDKAIFLDVRRTPTRSQIKRVEWDVTVLRETTLEDILRPEYWANVSGNTFFHHEHNIVSVYWEDDAQFAQLFVRQSGANFAIMEVLNHWNFDEKNEINQKDLYDVKWTGPSTKFRIIRISDNQIMKDGFKTVLEAEDFISKVGK